MLLSSIDTTIFSSWWLATGSIECLVGIFEEDSSSQIFDSEKSTFLFLLFLFGEYRVSGAFKKDLRDLRIVE